MSALKQKYEEFAEFMQHNTKGVEVSIFFYGIYAVFPTILLRVNKLCSIDLTVR